MINAEALIPCGLTPALASKKAAALACQSAGAPQALEAALGHLADHLLHHFKLLKQTVYIHHLQPATGSDALFPAGVEDLGIFPLQGSHRG